MVDIPTKGDPIPAKPEPGKLVLILKVPEDTAWRLFDTFHHGQQIGKTSLLLLPPNCPVEWWFAPPGSTSPVRLLPAPVAWTQEDEEKWAKWVATQLSDPDPQP